MRRRGLSLSILSLACGLVSSFAATEAGAVTAQSLLAAQTEGFSNSAAFNAGMGMGPQQQNQPLSISNLTANGTSLNGILSGSGSTQSSTGAGGSNMTSVGNDLNVSFTGSKNKTSSNSQQYTNSQQSSKSQQSSDSAQDSNTPLNGNLNF